MRQAEHVARMGAMRNLYKIFVGKPEGKIPPEIPRHRWEVNIKNEPLKHIFEGRGL